MVQGFSFKLIEKYKDMSQMLKNMENRITEYWNNGITLIDQNVVTYK